jgi:cbb3-type cytochrome oxidase cytochrome c subunit
MRGPTLALIIGVVVVVIATVIALQQLSKPPSAPTQTETPTPTTPSAGAAPSAEIKYDPQLAEKGRQYYLEIGCTACHSIKSLGIYGGAVGPDLSKTLLGNPGAGDLDK